MARLLALEWSETEARVVVANSRGDRVAFEQAFTVALHAGQPGTANVGQQLADALSARRLGRMDALVALGRSDVELRQLSMPPAPDNELPAMVRFQAGREFSALEEDWPLDFAPIDDDPEKARNVLAVACIPALVKEVGQVLETASLKPSRLILRPCATVSLLCRFSPPKPGEIRLLVDPLENGADLTVMVGDKVVFLRQAAMQGDALSEALLSEVRRTIPAAQSQLGGRRVESITLCGSSPEHEALAKSIQQQLSIPTETFDPFGKLTLEGELRQSLPEHAGRFGPLLGMLLDEAQQKRPAIDLLNPRKAPKSAGSRNTVGLVALIAAVLVMCAMFGGWYVNRMAKLKIEALANQSKALKTRLDAYDKFSEAADEIREWSYPDMIWLDEFHRLSANFAPNTAPERGEPDLRAMLTKVHMGRGREGGEIKLDGLAANVQAIKTLESNLTANKIFTKEDQGANQNEDGSTGSEQKDEGSDTGLDQKNEDSGAHDGKANDDQSRRVIISKDKREDKSRKPYNWRFSSWLVIKREKP